ncbi:MAG TPA: hypothetical protein VLA77_01705 [Candidatus Saccharimonadales bacterium]|nr:hypothetical protein [Candidatus Saccharimonadales bacterium]
MRFRSAAIGLIASAIVLAACGAKPETNVSAQAAAPTTTATQAASSAPTSTYPDHTNIIATIFYGGEVESEDNNWQTNEETAYCSDWKHCFGGVDDPDSRQHDGAWPSGFKPRENPFYASLPCNEFNENGETSGFMAIKNQIPWSTDRPEGSALKNRWVQITLNDKTVYAQIEETGPFETGSETENDCEYVFSTTDQRPKTQFGLKAGLDVSPATALALGLNIDAGFGVVDWRFVDDNDVPIGPWREIVTTSAPYWQ